MGPDVYVVMGSTGEYSSHIAWVAGVYDNKRTAIEEAEALKAADRSNWVIWCAWSQDRLKYYVRAGKRFNYPTRTEDAMKLGVPLEPPVGDPDSEYTVVSVPLNTRGRWDYA
jgi:hypothetical protein